MGPLNIRSQELGLPAPQSGAFSLEMPLESQVGIDSLSRSQARNLKALTKGRTSKKKFLQSYIREIAKRRARGFHVISFELWATIELATRMKRRTNREDRLAYTARSDGPNNGGAQSYKPSEAELDNPAADKRTLDYYDDRWAY